MRERKFLISINVESKIEEILKRAGNGNKSKGARVCAAFWDKEHHRSAPQVDDESVREATGFLDD